jgi:hypothetical protein
VQRMSVQGVDPDQMNDGVGRRVGRVGVGIGVGIGVGFGSVDGLLVDGRVCMRRGVGMIGLSALCTSTLDRRCKVFGGPGG